jgi:hypothetical protein
MLLQTCVKEFSFNLRASSWRGVLDTTLSDKVCKSLEADRWFSLGNPVSSTNKTDHHEISEILLNVVLHIITLTPNMYREILNCLWHRKIFSKNQRLPGACNRSPGSKLLSITTQLHCGGHLGGRARLPDTILEEDHPMTIPSMFGSNWATGSRQTLRPRWPPQPNLV